MHQAQPGREAPAAPGHWAAGARKCDRVTGLRGAALGLALAAAAIAASAGAAAVLLIGAGLGPLAGAAVRLLTSNPTPGGRLAIGAAVSAPVLLLGALL